MILVSLTKQEIELSEKRGRERYKRRAGLEKALLPNSIHDEEQDIFKAGAEYAVGKYYGWIPNFETFNPNDGPGYSFLVCGKKIEVNWTPSTSPDGRHRSQAKLSINPADQAADIYICVTGSPRKGLRLLGWTTRENLVELPKHDFGCGERYAMPERFLNPPLTLPAFVERGYTEAV